MIYLHKYNPGINIPGFFIYLYMKKINNFIEESLYNHLSVLCSTNIHNIHEKNGKLNGVENVINRMIDDIYVNDKNVIKYNFEYNDINITIYLHIENSSNIIANYDQSKTDYNNNIIYINLQYPKDEDVIDKISNLLSHELLHGVEDLICHYEMSIELKNTNNNIRNINNIPSITRQISTYAYLLDYHERNAYMSQLTNDIVDIINKHNWNDMTIDFKKLISELKENNTIWKIYFNFNSFICNFENDETGLYIKEYNKIYKNNFTKQQAIKHLKNKFNKFAHKFNNLVPKIVCDKLPKYEGLLPSGFEELLFVEF